MLVVASLDASLDVSKDVSNDASSGRLCLLKNCKAYVNNYGT
jgi:hypothetical protein